MFLKPRPILFLILPLMVVMSSCLKGDLEDLEKQLAELEKALGSNEPLVMNFSTTTTEGEAIVKNAAFLFKVSDANGNYMVDGGDGYYYIYVSRGLDINHNEGLGVYFEYHAETKEVVDIGVEMGWYDKYFRWINPYFYDGQANAQMDFKLNSINTKTGQVSFSINVQTNEDFANEYSGQPMTCKVDFNGTLGVFID